jgi:hypothetical protein
VRSSAASTVIAAGSSIRSGSPCAVRERRASSAPALRIAAVPVRSAAGGASCRFPYRPSPLPFPGLDGQRQSWGITPFRSARRVPYRLPSRPCHSTGNPRNFQCTGSAIPVQLQCGRSAKPQAPTARSGTEEGMLVISVTYVRPDNQCQDHQFEAFGASVALGPCSLIAASSRIRKMRQIAYHHRRAMRGSDGFAGQRIIFVP